MFEREPGVKILGRPCVSSTDHAGIAVAPRRMQPDARRRIVQGRTYPRLTPRTNAITTTNAI